jgi:hypothetical protein
MNPKRSILLAIGLAIWLTLVIVGLGILRGYSLTPGSAGTPQASWPSESHISRPSRYFTLVMAIHPHCPCSRASIGELAILMAHSEGRLVAFVVFVQPPGFDENWTKSDLWSSAEAIPGVTSIIDRGAEAKLFGAATSGQTMVYDLHGRLLFSGGITAARGHFGDSAGVSAIARLIDVSDPGGPARAAYGRKSAAYASTTPVFGCPLFARPTNSKSEQDKCAK